MKIIYLLLAAVMTANIATAQSIGIGTTAPNSKAQLDVVSTTKGLLIPRMTSADRLAISSPVPAGLMVYETTTNSFWFFNGLVWNQIGTGGASPWTVSGTNINNSNTGNVGIGTSTNINQKLTVKGDALFVYPGSNNVTLSLMANTNNQARINFIKPDSSILASIYSYDLVDRLYLQQGTNTNQLVLNNNGFVGIRNSVPTEALDVTGSIRSRDTITADDDLVAGDDIRAGGSITGSGLNSNGGLYVTGSSLLEGNITGIANFSCLGTGSITGNITTYSGVTISDAAGILSFKTGVDDKGFVQLSGDNLRLGTYNSNTNGKFVVRTGSNDRLVIDNTGTVQLNGGTDAGLTTHGYLMLGQVSGSNLIFDNNEIMARNNGAYSSLVLQNDGGSVRIGNVAAPTGYKFAINGKMICEEVKVKLASSGWPDYVFAGNYKLKPLQEVEGFINQHKHLPNIPSAAEVEKNGIEIGDMQKRMMEKIEELTLYVIELEKKINELKKNQ